MTLHPNIDYGTLNQLLVHLRTFGRNTEADCYQDANYVYRAAREIMEKNKTQTKRRTLSQDKLYALQSMQELKPRFPKIKKRKSN
jgi:hypothetical protein